MTDIKIKQHNGFLIGSFEELKESDLDCIIETTKLPPEERKGPLSGRGFISHTDLPKIGKVVVKRYTHGGLVNYVNKSYYFKFGKFRPQPEFEILRKIKALGIHTPKPIAFIVQGHFVYKAWLITQEIVNNKTLAELSLTDEDRARKVMPEVTKQIDILIENRICHIDLHPGNVLVDPYEKAYIIDFDKAYLYKRSLNSLRDYYLCRWRRAVIKHHLPEYLSELFCVELLKNYDRPQQ
ncbi:MAG: lipopolysaccharide kinase InaA family protein [Bdellovibrionota bacterium]|jgi:3-deoxy-D-manno-octulosonic acid kinase